MPLDDPVLKFIVLKFIVFYSTVAVRVKSCKLLLECDAHDTDSNRTFVIILDRPKFRFSVALRITTVCGEACFGVSAWLQLSLRLYEV
jgi:hypothetical protein